MKKIIFISFISIFAFACGNSNMQYDATGIFEATEVIVSSQAIGQIEEFSILEGDILEAGQMVGYIDSTQLYYQKLQLLSNKKAILASRPDINKQIQAAKEQLENAKREKVRIEKLLKGDAATQKQLDDITSQINVLEGMLSAQMNSIGATVGSIDGQSSTVQIQVVQIDDQLKKCRITNPIKGTVLSKYAQAKEIANIGKPLYKIADIENMFLRVYVIAPQLTQLKIGQTVKVFADWDEDDKREYQGIISWISDKAEFTPKTIQTRDERANLVYAVKITVKNDGYIKKGMYGEMEIKN